MVKVNWVGGMAFEATPPSGNKILMDAYPESGGTGNAPTPVEALLSSVAACTAMDVISILKKKRQVVTSYRVEIEGERAPEGEFPRPFLSMVVRHILAGENLDPEAVARSVELSDTKYCTVVATLRQAPAISSEWKIE